MKKTTCAFAAGLLLAGLPGLAFGLQVDPSLKVKAAGLFDGARDLDLNDQGNNTQGYVDVYPALHLQFSDDFAAYFRAEGFLPSGRLVQKQNNAATPQRGYGALREAWFEYGGITSYPGEVLRLGLQRVRDPDGLWWDQDIEALRWIFDTTLLQAQVGVAQQFSSWRTDSSKLPPSQKDRAYAFAALAGQWQPGHFAGVRVAWAGDHGDTPATGTMPASDAKLQDRRYGWVGAHVDNGYYAIDSERMFWYWTELVTQFGSQQDVVVDPLTGLVVGTTRSDVRAFGGDAGVRYRVSQAYPLQLGAAYAYGQGGSGSGERNNFHQTGLQSNRSRFTGTRSLIYRFNEALEADLSNLSVITAYLSMPLRYYDASLVLHKFRRNDETQPISTAGLDVKPSTPSNDLGNAADLVFTRYFDKDGREDTPGEDTRNNVRLRGSVFQPGDAYGTDARNRYKVVLETTLWF